MKLEDAKKTRRRWMGQCSAWMVAAVAAAASPVRVLAAPAGSERVILVVGDSLSAEYGLKRGAGWVSLLERRLAQQKIAAKVINASVSGDTTSGGRSRLPALLKQHQPTHVVLELGGNDALRGLPLAGTEANLLAMAQASKAAAEKAALLPFLLKGVADGPDATAMFQADRLHPAESAHPIILDNVWAVLRPMLG